MSDVFDEVIEFPDAQRGKAFAQLKGLDETKRDLVKHVRLLLNPTLLDDWSKKHHGELLPAVAHFHDRPPLVLFSGDVGTGKTALAETFGHEVARTEKIPVRAMHLSLKARGAGAVGEMTRLVTTAFDEVEKIAAQAQSSGNKPGSATILIIDEADALAQSRGLDQMHHEDRAGVNALIRGINRLTSKSLPVVVVMCTNRVDAIDPAVMRRASAHFTFERPNEERRHEVLADAFGSVLSKDELGSLVNATGSVNGRNYGFTYSDLTQRLIPNILLAAFPDHPVTVEIALSVATMVRPTTPFTVEGHE